MGSALAISNEIGADEDEPVDPHEREGRCPVQDRLSRVAFMLYHAEERRSLHWELLELALDDLSRSSRAC